MQYEKYKDAIQRIKDSSLTSSVYVGTDSQVFSKKDKSTKETYKEAHYSTVIILHMDSCRGASIIYKSAVKVRDYVNMRQRLIAEVSMTVEAALAISPYVGERVFEVHLDISGDEENKSSLAVKEAIGYVTGTLGFAPKIKPHSFAATHCSDKVVKGKLKAVDYSS